MTSTEHVGENAPLDWVKLEADVTAAIPARSLMPINRALSVQSDPMPDYVKHQDGVPRVGALSAEAMVRDHESAAKEIEAMGAELISAAMRCDDGGSAFCNLIYARHCGGVSRGNEEDLEAHRGLRVVDRTCSQDVRDTQTSN